MSYFFDFALLTLIYFLFFYRKWSRNSKTVLIMNTFMYIYIVMVLFVTLMPFKIPLINGTNNLFVQTANFIPFRDLKSNYNGAVREIALNCVMMIPFGLLYPIIKKQGILKTIISTFLFSLTIELLQLLSAWWAGLSSRSFDITDLITNTVGGLIGYIIFLVLKLLIFKVLRKQQFHILLYFH